MSESATAWREHGLQILGLGIVAALLFNQLRQQSTGDFDITQLLDNLFNGIGATQSKPRGLKKTAKKPLSGENARKPLTRRSSSGDFSYMVEEDSSSYGKLCMSPHASKNVSGGEFGDFGPSVGGGLRAQSQLGLEEPLVIAMVGLPARGKSYLVKMLMRYLKWMGYDCEVFNVGSLRRSKGMAGIDSSFFDTSNQSANQIREDMARAVQDAMYEWIHEGDSGNPRIAIFDATNTTRSRRLAVATRAREESAGLLFVESICNDQEVLQKNYEMKLQNDDYKGMDPAAARRDFAERVAAYERVYETIGDEEVDGQISYIQLINVGQKVITRNCSGFLSSQISFYLQNVHINERKIYLTLTGENAEEAQLLRGRADSLLSGEATPLSKAGNDYAEKLGKYLQTVETNEMLLVLSGTQIVHAETILHLRPNFSCFSTPLLNELRGGDLHGLSTAQIKARFPEEHAKRERDKLAYRFPGHGGESYIDVIERAKPVIIELERQRRSVVVCAHIAVIRVIYAYFMNVELTEIPHLIFKPHVLYAMNPTPFSTNVSEIKLL